MQFISVVVVVVAVQWIRRDVVVDYRNGVAAQQMSSGTQQTVAIVRVVVDVAQIVVVVIIIVGCDNTTRVRIGIWIDDIDVVVSGIGGDVAASNVCRMIAMNVAVVVVIFILILIYVNGGIIG